MRKATYAITLALLSGTAVTQAAGTEAYLVAQDQHMSRVVPISLDAGKTWTPVWAGIKTGSTPAGQYNFFCNEVRMPSTFGKPMQYTASHEASPRLKALVSRAHDLGQLNPDAAAAMQLVIWDLHEDGTPNLKSGSFQARTTIAVQTWVDLFAAQAMKPELPGSKVTILKNPATQDVVVMDYGMAPAVPGTLAEGGAGTPAYVPWGVGDPSGGAGSYGVKQHPSNQIPEPGTLALLAISALAALATIKRSKQ